MIKIEDKRELDKLIAPFFAEMNTDIYLVHTNDKHEFTMINISKGKTCTGAVYDTLDELLNTHLKLRPINAKIVIEK